MSAAKEADLNVAGASKSEWIDISKPLSNEMDFIGNTFHKQRFLWIQGMNPFAELGGITEDYVMQLIVHTHCGTHIDAPRHFPAQSVPDYRTSIDEIPLDDLIGPVRVIEIKSTLSIKPEELEPHNIQAGERILFKTINSSYSFYVKDGKVDENRVTVSTEAASFLADKKVKLVGLDYVFIGPFNDLQALGMVHITLLNSGIWILEDIDLSGVEAGQYEMVCLPLRILDGDAGPVRAILRPL